MTRYVICRDDTNTEARLVFDNKYLVVYIPKRQIEQMYPGSYFNIDLTTPWQDNREIKLWLS